MPIPAEAFVLDRETTVPLQTQLRRQIIAAILAGRFKAGDKLPSGRHLAQRLGVARVTVAHAYAELVATDYLISRDRSGHYIADQITPLPPPTHPSTTKPFDWSTVLDDRLLNARRTDHVTDWRHYQYPFVYGQADPDLVDHIAWRECATQALGRREFVPMTGDLYDHDDPELVDYIIRHILPRRGVTATAEQVLLTSGAQNGLWLAATLMLAKGQTAVFEDPGYPGLRTILTQTQARMVQLSIDADGMNPDAIPADTRAVFTTASHHCPTGITLSPARRADLLERALANGFAIIEDDYEFESSFVGAASPALKAMDHAGAVIYVGSFSKTVFPGLRLGYLVADPTVIERARTLRTLTMRHPPGMLQRTLAHFLAQGHYDTQMNRMRRIYATRRAVMAQALVANGLLDHPTARGGSSFWLPTHGLASDRLAAELRGNGVLIESGRPFFVDPQQGAHHYRLAYSSISADRIPEGIARIGRAMHA